MRDFFKWHTYKTEKEMKKWLFVFMAIFSIACSQNANQKTKEQLKLSTAKKVTFTLVSDSQIIDSRIILLGDGDTIDPIDVVNAFIDTGMVSLYKKSGYYDFYDSIDSVSIYRYTEYDWFFLISKHERLGLFLIKFEDSENNVRILIDSLNGMSRQDLKKMQNDVIQKVDNDYREFINELTSPQNKK